MSWCASAAELVTPGGALVRGEARASGGTLTVADTTIPVESIVALRFGARRSGSKRFGPYLDRAGARVIDRGLVFVSGDVLAGSVVRLHSGKIEFFSDTLGIISVPVLDAAAVVFVPRSLAQLSSGSFGDRLPNSDTTYATQAPGSTTSPISPPESSSLSPKLGHPGHNEQGAVLTNGDVVSGKVISISRRAVGVSTGGRIVRIPRERIAGVYLGGPSSDTSRAPPQPRQYMRLVNGDRLSGSLLRLTAGRLELRTAFAKTVRVRVSQLHELWSEGGTLVPVSTLTPSEVRQVPQFDEVFPHRVDRSLAGGFLSIGGRRYERGLGCHSRCELVYDLGKAYSTFLAEVGVDDHVGRRGEVVFRCLADGKVVFESGVCRGGEPARVVRASVAGARKLRLVVDFGPGGVSAGDHAVWGRAVLVRQEKKSNHR